MRAFTLVSGTSSKFWEIDRDGTTVTVRFGRIGTQGQTQVKDLGSDAAALAHHDKLVAEKVKKGYVESSPGVPAPTSAPAPAPPKLVAPKPAEPDPGEADVDELDVDEDTWTVPSAWWRLGEPFRDQGPKTSVKLDAKAEGTVADLRAKAAPAITKLLEQPASDPELVAALELELGTKRSLLRSSKQQHTPLGAAVLAAVLRLEWRDGQRAAALADVWVAQDGLPFAAEATVLLGGIAVDNPARHSQWVGPPPTGLALIRTGPAHYSNDIATRMRRLLAAGSDDEHQAVLDRLSALPDLAVGPRLVRAYLLPEQTAWVDEAITQVLQRQGGAFTRILSSARTADQVLALVNAFRPWSFGNPSEISYTAAARVGPPLAPVLAHVFDAHTGADLDKRVVSLLAAFPTDEALELLLRRLDQKYVQPAVLEAMGRFPRRATRLLASHASGASATAKLARELLRGHLLSHPSLAGRVTHELSPEASSTLQKVQSLTVATAPVADDQIPALLAAPPWATRKAAQKPTVLADLAATSPTRLAWLPGEQQAWAEEGGRQMYLTKNPDWPELMQRATQRNDWQQISILSMAPENLVRPVLATSIKPDWAYDAGPSLKRILGRFGEDAIGYVLRVVLMRPASTADVLMPLEGSEIADRMAEWYQRSKTVRTTALAWLLRHPESAARDLIPAALGKLGKARVEAETALCALAANGHREAVLRAAESYGSPAQQGIQLALDADPLDQLPARMPALPSWLEPSHLPPLLVADRSGALPPAAVGNLVLMFALSKPGEPYAGIEAVRSELDPASLAQLAWGLFERWRGVEYPSKDGWVLQSLGLVGDDEVVRDLSGLIRVWPGEGAHLRAVSALDVLSAIGTDVALMHLHGIAEKVSFKGLKTKAQEKIAEVAETLNLTTEQLADRLVPDLGLDTHGGMVLDYGPRRFRVGFDEQLKPTVADEDGTHRKVLPKPSAKDDEGLATAAYARFSGLKKDVKTIATDQIRRMERAMVAQRQWTSEEHRTLFVEHPLMWHLARRLVWLTSDDRGVVTGSFRVAEDRTLATSEDDETFVDESAFITIAHPLLLDDGTLRAWSEVFADYEILQPFQQLGRDTFALTPAERTGLQLTRFEGSVVSTGRVLALSHKGWQRGDPQDAGIIGETTKALKDGGYAVIDLDPGIIVGMPMEWPEQTIRKVWIGTSRSTWGQAEGSRDFSSIDAVSASELIRDLEGLRA